MKRSPVSEDFRSISKLSFAVFSLYWFLYNNSFVDRIVGHVRPRLCFGLWENEWIWCKEYSTVLTCSLRQASCAPRVWQACRGETGQHSTRFTLKKQATHDILKTLCITFYITHLTQTWLSLVTHTCQLLDSVRGNSFALRCAGESMLHSSIANIDPQETCERERNPGKRIKRIHSEKLTRMLLKGIWNMKMLLQVALNLLSWMCPGLNLAKDCAFLNSFSILTEDLEIFEAKRIPGSEQLSLLSNVVSMCCKQWLAARTLPTEFVRSKSRLSLGCSRTAFWFQRYSKHIGVILWEFAAVCCSLLQFAAVCCVCLPIPLPLGFNAALDACLKAGQWKRSLKLFREISKRNFTADKVSCNVAIVSASLLSTWQLGLSFLNGLQADAITFSSCISACERNHQWSLALTYLDRLQQRHFEPYSICCNSAVKACARRWHLSCELMGAMQDSKIRSDGYTYSSVISACDGEWEMALQSLMQTAAHEVVYNAAINTCAHGGWIVGVWLLDEMQSQGIKSKAGIGASEISYTAAFYGCGAARWELAERLFSKMPSLKASTEPSLP